MIISIYWCYSVWINVLFVTVETDSHMGMNNMRCFLQQILHRSITFKIKAPKLEDKGSKIIPEKHKKIPDFCLCPTLTFSAFKQGSMMTFVRDNPFAV